MTIRNSPGTPMTTDSSGNPAGNMALLAIGKNSIPHNRELLDVSTIESVTWVAVEGITEVTVVVHPAAGTPAIGDGVFVCFNAPDAATAAIWVAEAQYTATDSHRHFIGLDKPRTFPFDNSEGTGVVLNAYAIVAADSAITAAHVIFEAN